MFFVPFVAILWRPSSSFVLRLHRRLALPLGSSKNPNYMTVREIFALRKQGHIEEAYEAIRPMYRVHNGHYTSLCMYLCARDIFNIRLTEGRIAEATKIYQALQRLVPFIEDKDGKALPSCSTRLLPP